MKPAPFHYQAPATLDEVVGLLAEHGDDCKLLAGGQSLVPLLNLRMSTPSVLIDLRRVPQLRAAPSVDGGEVRLTAMTTYQELLESDVVRDRLPLLTDAVPYVGHQAIRNAGTIGGSVAHADPSAELPAVLVALGARIGVVGSAGERIVDADDFFTGVFTTSLAPDELVAWVACPALGPRHGWAWTEVAPRHGDYAVVGVGTVVVLDGPRIEQIRVCLASVADVPYLAHAPGRLVGREPAEEGIAAVAKDVAAEVRPLPDLVASTTYKTHLVELLTARAIASSVRRALTRTPAEGLRP